MDETQIKPATDVPRGLVTMVAPVQVQVQLQ